MAPQEEPSILNLFTLLTWLHIPKPGEPADFTRARKGLYVGKIINLFWFEGDLPASENDPLDIYFNPVLYNSSVLPNDFEGIMNLSERELRFICRRITQTNWVRQKFIKNSLRLDEIPELWKDV